MLSIMSPSTCETKKKNSTITSTYNIGGKFHREIPIAEKIKAQN
jgi:hypothetical protein